MKSRDILKQKDKERNLWDIVEENDIHIRFPPGFVLPNGHVSKDPKIEISIMNLPEDSSYRNQNEKS